MDDQSPLGSPPAGLEDLARLAREALDRVEKRPDKDLSDWLTIGTALMAGRAEAMRQAMTNEPMGGAYNSAFNRWLAKEKLDRVSKIDRGRLLLIMERKEEVLAWHSTLTIDRALRLRTPQSIFERWRKETQPPKPKDPTEPPKETQRDANLRLQEENDQLKAENSRLKDELRQGREWAKSSPSSSPPPPRDPPQDEQEVERRVKEAMAQERAAHAKEQEDLLKQLEQERAAGVLRFRQGWEEAKAKERQARKESRPAGQTVRKVLEPKDIDDLLKALTSDPWTWIGNLDLTEAQRETWSLIVSRHVRGMQIVNDKLSQYVKKGRRR